MRELTLHDADACPYCGGINVDLLISDGHYFLECDDCGYTGKKANSESNAVLQWNREWRMEDDLAERMDKNEERKRRGWNYNHFRWSKREKKGEMDD